MRAVPVEAVICKWTICRRTD